ncbi:MAG: NADAR family protein [Sporocytophaga sp.]|nr:NADAR family protein [Sporocytophaga sp.]
MVKCLREIRNEKETFTFFWETQSPFSQWHKSKFQGSSALFLNENEREKILGHNKPSLEFTSAEQFMMYHKAILFLNTETAKQILKVTNPREIKELGRQVKDFDKDVWSFFRSKIVYEANKAKFSQKNSLKDALILTKGTTLVEAAPNDKIWGIGLTEDDYRAQNRKTWHGKNLLGEILTLLRIEFMGMY